MNHRLSFRLLLLLVASLSSAPIAAVSIETVPVMDPGNACDDVGGGRCWGAVGYGFRMGTFEVTNGQYAEFLNAVAATDDHALFSMSMATDPRGGIERSGDPGSYAYAVRDGRGNMPVNFVGYSDAIRFVNWLANGQPVGAQDASTTEDGSYAFNIFGAPGNRNPDAAIFLPNNDEWHKAAYYDAASVSFMDYPGGTISNVTCSAPTDTPHRYNCGFAVGDLTDVGSYAGTPSSYGSFDQGGNVWELLDGPASFRMTRGGSWDGSFADFEAGTSAGQGGEFHYVGFRIAMIPEPATGLMVVVGLLLLSIHCKKSGA